MNPAAVNAAPTSITDCLGEVRPVTRLWTDGSWQCPFCGYPVAAARGETSCQNPWCSATGNAFDANGIQTPASVVWFRELAEKLAQARLEREQREANHRAAMDRIERERVARREWIAEQWSIAAAANNPRPPCRRCSVVEPGRQVKIVRHRNPCPRN